MKLFEVDQTIGKNVPEIYVDLDGVLADFFGHWSRMDGKDHYKEIEDKEAKLQLVREHPTFWLDLPVLPNADKLLNFVKKNFGHYNICSKPLDGDPYCEPQKREWIKKHLSFFPPYQVIITKNKAAYATQFDGSPNILIDDYGPNVDAWNAAGGFAIKYKDHKFDRAVQELEDYLKARSQA